MIIIKKKLQKFDELDVTEKYNAIWACASILYVAMKDLPLILKRMANAIKEKGIIYT